MLSLSSAQGGQIDSCFEFFEALAPGTSGACADFSFFGFTGTVVENISTANGGATSASIDAFEEFDILPEFFDPAEPNFATVEVKTTGDAGGITEFTIEHKDRVGMFPFSEAPPPGTATDRFLTVGSQSKLVFRADKPGAIGEVPLELKLEQDMELIDPFDSSIDGDVGSYFLIDFVEVDTDQLIEELLGISKFDSALDPEPDFDDEFAPGYEGFTTTTTPQPGQANVDFNRTLEMDIELEVDIELETLSSLSIFTDGFESGNTNAWSTDTGNTFTFRVSSPDPGVRFILNLDTTPGVVLPTLDVSLLNSTQVRLRWDALDTQTYTILFTQDLALPTNQWQEMGTVSGTAGEVTRDKAIVGEDGFFALSVTSS